VRKQALVPKNVPSAYWENWWTEVGPAELPADFADLAEAWPDGWITLVSDRDDADAEVDAEVLAGRLASGLYVCRISDFPDDQLVVDDYGHAVALGEGPFQTMTDISAKNAANGYHFFDADTMRFFDSRIEAGPIGGRFFVTSEQFHGSNGSSGPRGFTVRVAHDTGNIGTIGGFAGPGPAGDGKGGYATKAEAIAAANECARRCSRG